MLTLKQSVTCLNSVNTTRRKLSKTSVDFSLTKMRRPNKSLSMSLRLSRSRLKLSLTTDLKSKSTLIKSKRLQIQSLWHKRSHRHGMISKNGCKIKSLWKIHQWKNNSSSVRKNCKNEQNFWYQFIRICLKLNTLKNFWWNTLLKRLWRDWMSSVFSRKWMRFRKNSIS